MRLRTENLRKEYREANGELRVIENLSVEFATASTIAIVGRSGVGKSTLLHLLGGLDHPTSGKVWYDEADIFSLSHEKLSRFRGKHVGFIFQFHHLLPEFNALENVAMPLTIAGEEEAMAHGRARTLLCAVGLEGRLDHRPSQLSGGEQQRVAIARALVSQPSVVLADEPTGNLDLRTAAEVQDLLLEACRSQGTTLIVVTHSEELASSLDIRFEMGMGGTLTAAA